jgi:hypothetical protein
VNSVNFKKIGNISARGSNQIYNFSTSIQQNTWYRIKQVDNDGTFVYSKSLLLYKAQKKSFEMVNNPLLSELKFVINDTKSSIFSVEIFSVDGKRVFYQSYQSQIGSSNITIPAPKTKGTYIAKYSSGSTSESVNFVIL